MIATAEAAGVTLMVGYMKRYDPAYLYAQRLMPAMRDRVTYVQINTLHPPIQVHLTHHRIQQFNDVPVAAIAQVRAESQALIDEALGADHHPWLNRAFPDFILGSMVHDLNALRGLFGEPAEVLYTDFWDGGDCITTILRYDPDVRVQYSWTFLRDVRHYDETLSFYGTGARLHVKFPSPFLMNEPTLIVTEGMEDDVAWERTATASYEEAFKEELRHFYDCITTGQRPRTDGLDGRRDVELLRDITIAWRGARGKGVGA
jgi:predicted dehydrogenase